MIRKCMVLTALAASAVCPAIANATPVSIWNYELTTSFTGVNTFGPGNGLQLQTDTQVSWGEAGGNVFIDGGNRSGITISDVDGTGAEDPTASPIIGTVTTNAVIEPGIGLGAWITHHNNVLNASLATLRTTQLESVLTMTPNTPMTPGSVGPSSLLFTVFFAETPNSTPCAAASPPGNPCNDIFAINSSQAFNQAFSFDGLAYFVSIFPIINGSPSTFPTLTSGECLAAGANNGCVGFTTVEGQNTTVRFGFAVTSRAIDLPEPGSLGLIAAALSAMGVAYRRRRGRA
jgi:PEP-CTERM motif-containing protein